MASKGTHKKPRASRTTDAVATALLASYPQAPRKVRLVTDLVKGKTVAAALAELSFLPKRSALPVKKLIESAVASAKAKGADVETLRIKNITVDESDMLVRYMPRAFGRAAPVRRRKSRVALTLTSAAA
jgi:large subunit ribosomal protein L22